MLCICVLSNSKDPVLDTISVTDKYKSGEIVIVANHINNRITSLFEYPTTDNVIDRTAIQMFETGIPTSYITNAVTIPSKNAPAKDHFVQLCKKHGFRYAMMCGAIFNMVQDSIVEKKEKATAFKGIQKFLEEFKDKMSAELGVAKTEIDNKIASMEQEARVFFNALANAHNTQDEEVKALAGELEKMEIDTESSKRDLMDVSKLEPESHAKFKLIPATVKNQLMWIKYYRKYTEWDDKDVLRAVLMARVAYFTLDGITKGLEEVAIACVLIEVFFHVNSHYKDKQMKFGHMYMPFHNTSVLKHFPELESKIIKKQSKRLESVNPDAVYYNSVFKCYMNLGPVSVLEIYEGVKTHWTNANMNKHYLTPYLRVIVDNVDEYAMRWKIPQGMYKIYEIKDKDQLFMKVDIKDDIDTEFDRIVAHTGMSQLTLDPAKQTRYVKDGVFLTALVFEINTRSPADLNTITEIFNRFSNIYYSETDVYDIIIKKPGVEKIYIIKPSSKTFVTSDL